MHATRQLACPQGFRSSYTRGRAPGGLFIAKLKSPAIHIHPPSLGQPAIEVVNPAPEAKHRIEMNLFINGTGSRNTSKVQSRRLVRKERGEFGCPMAPWAEERVDGHMAEEVKELLDTGMHFHERRTRLLQNV